MPLSRKIISETPVVIGNALTIGSLNEEFRSGINLSAWNDNLTEQDYYAGSVSYLYCISFNITVDPLADIGFSASNPIRQNYGEVNIRNLDGFITESHTLKFQKQQIQLNNYRHVLPRQEAARPKQYKLSSRPRFLASSSVAQSFPITGRFPGTSGLYSGTGIIGPTPGTFTETGSVNFQAVLPPTLDIARRSLILDITDGDFGLTASGNGQGYFGNTNYDNSIDIYRPGAALIYLVPGATGTVKLDVYKLVEPTDPATSQVPVYVPTATFPPI